MKVKGLMISACLGAAAGAVAILSMHRSNPTRRLAAKAANRMEEAVWKVSNKISDEFDF